MIFSEAQLRELEYGKEVGLTEEQIDLYRLPDFDDEQMEALRVVLMQGADYKVLKNYCNPSYEPQLLKFIGWAVKNKFSKIEIQSIIEAEEPFEQYEDILFEKGL